jgi:hypothetical protein
MQLYDRIMAEEHEVRAWESHQLRASSPDGNRAVWLLHDIVADGPTWAERTVQVQLLAFERDGAVHAARADYRWNDMTRLFRGPQIEGPSGHYEPGAAKGQIADTAWDLVSAGGLPAIRHLPHDFLYATGRSNNKLVTPQPCLKVAGTVDLGETRWELDGWVGSRTHLWGPGVGARAGWLACHRWSDDAQRALEGFVGNTGLGELAVMVLEGPESAHWVRRGELVGSPPQELRSSRGGYTLSARAERLLSLRTPAPGGDVHRRVSPFASVELRSPRGTADSQCGGLEFLEEQAPPAHAWPPADYDGSALAVVI